MANAWCSSRSRRGRKGAGPGPLGQAAKEYLRRLGNPETKFRFDIVEVLLLDGEVSEVRHLPNAFPLTRPKRIQ